jgi:hypothetical protein
MFANRRLSKLRRPPPSGWTVKGAARSHRGVAARRVPAWRRRPADRARVSWRPERLPGGPWKSSCSEFSSFVSGVDAGQGAGQCPAGAVVVRGPGRGCPGAARMATGQWGLAALLIPHGIPRHELRTHPPGVMPPTLPMPVPAGVAPCRQAAAAVSSNIRRWTAGVLIRTNCRGSVADPGPPGARRCRACTAVEASAPQRVESQTWVSGDHGLAASNWVRWEVRQRRSESRSPRPGQSLVPIEPPMALATIDRPNPSAAQPAVSRAVSAALAVSTPGPALRRSTN